MRFEDPNSRTPSCTGSLCFIENCSPTRFKWKGFDASANANGFVVLATNSKCSPKSNVSFRGLFAVLRLSTRHLSTTCAVRAGGQWRKEYVNVL